MYKILNKLFGWDYIFWATETPEGFSYKGIAKIITLPDGSSHFWVNNYLCKINNKDLQIKFLTCKPDKYIKTL